MPCARSVADERGRPAARAAGQLRPRRRLRLRRTCGCGCRGHPAWRRLAAYVPASRRSAAARRAGVRGADPVRPAARRAGVGTRMGPPRSRRTSGLAARNGHPRLAPGSRRRVRRPRRFALTAAEVVTGRWDQDGRTGRPAWARSGLTSCRPTEPAGDGPAVSMTTQPARAAPPQGLKTPLARASGGHPRWRPGLGLRRASPPTSHAHEPGCRPGRSPGVRGRGGR